ncbi:MAG: dienelactone hydrolase [Saprospiraceae bacterium]
MKLWNSFVSMLLILLFLSNHSLSQAQSDSLFINGDGLPDAPELSKRGEYQVGVRTLDFINKHQIDILNSKNGRDTFYDRPLKVEIWYPALIPEGKNQLASYEDVLGSIMDSTRPLIPFTFSGRALRDAQPDLKPQAYPLIIVSHGYTGSRVLLSYLTENLASKGYVVVAIDHTESTHRDQKGFTSTLLNRNKDIQFILNQMAEPGKVKGGSFLVGLLDADHTALIGYSMGGYGVLNVAGAGYSDQLAGFFSASTGGSKAIDPLCVHKVNYLSSVDSRIKAVVAFAPWGMKNGVWDSVGLQRLKVPTLFVAGDQDDVSGYEGGIKSIFLGAKNANRYLLTYENARHNIAPNPPPTITLFQASLAKDYEHYSEPAWNEKRINNINQHFVTAFLGIYLQNRTEYGKYLDVSEKSNEKAWLGFKPRACLGLELRHLLSGN